MHYFISDIHLGILNRKEDKPREELFIKTLEKMAIDAEEIFLVGDIFDYWFEYRSVVPAYFYRTLTAISKLVDNNIKITYLMGNHDFGHRNFFKNEFGIEVIRHDIERNIKGKKFYIAHGDGKAHNDTGYLILKSILRSRWANFLYRIIHPDIGIALASGSSKKSRIHTDSKDYGNKDGMVDFAKLKLSEGFDYVVMGHRHKVIRLPHANGEYINLGEWIKFPHIGRFDGTNFEIIEVNGFLETI